MRRLKQWIDVQPEWSDFPFILITSRGGGLERNPAAGRHLDTLGNVTVIERPFHPTTLVSLAKAVLRGRRRQFEARARLEALAESEATRDEVVGQPFWETPWFADSPEAAAEMRRAAKTAADGGEYRGEITVALPRGTRTMDLGLRPVRGGDGKLRGIVPEAIDITERRLAEEALRQLTGGVAHDFNNLLSPILGCLDLLQRNDTGNAREKRTIEGALQAADRAKTLVQRLLAFARRQPLQSTAVDIAKLIRDMESLVRTTIGSAIQLSIDIPQDLPLANADANQLEMALLNLCVNARDAMPEGGMLRIAVSAERLCSSSPAMRTPPDYRRIWCG